MERAIKKRSKGVTSSDVDRKRKGVDNNYLSTEDFQGIVPFINASANKFFTKEQFDKLKNDYPIYWR